ncbi:hypothetical protein ACFC96_26915 [Streptomyces sp. NPDC055955]|uniref:hypothetical protein n=1 Tax=Streptomyces sp. NPDC055955 TaxID=3345665 RepID=UPI0035E1427E
MRIGLLTLAAFSGLASLASCSPQGAEIPKSICGTHVNAKLVEPLLRATGKVSESHTAGWGKRETNWCIVRVAGDESLRLKFAWHSDTMDPMKSASPNNNVTGLWEPTQMNLADKAALGDDGAIATTRCRTKPDNHFTLTLKLSHRSDVPHHRRDIEKFMRAYMPATMKAVGCTHP